MFVKDIAVPLILVIVAAAFGTMLVAYVMQVLGVETDLFNSIWNSLFGWLTDTVKTTLSKLIDALLYPFRAISDAVAGAMKSSLSNVPWQVWIAVMVGGGLAAYFLIKYL